MTTATQEQIITEALRGPWTAVLADRYGDVMTWEDYDGDGIDADDVKVVIVRGTAAPDEYGHLPGSYMGDDLLVEWDDFEDHAQVEARLAQAQAMVQGLHRFESPEADRG